MCFVILIILLLSKILTYCFLKNKFYKETLLCLSFIFLELFYFNKIYDFLATPGISRYFIYFISVIFLIFFNLISLYILIKIKKKLLLFSKIFILLTIINIFVQNYLFISTNASSGDLTFKKFSYPTSKLKENVYLIVADEMSSFEIYLKDYPQDLETIQQFRESIIKNNSIYLSNSRSNYNYTHLSLTSYLYLGNFININSKYYSRDKFFPNNLYYEPLEAPLLRYLHTNNQAFINIGNSEMNRKIKYSDKKKLIPDDIDILFKFLQPTPLDELIRILLRMQFKNSKHDIYLLNDGITQFINNIDKYNFSAKSFYFIHHFSPHAPYLFDENCKKNSQSNIFKKGFNEILWPKSYKCVLKKINFFIETINKIDPTGIVIIQGDHSHWRDHKSINRYSVFNLIKLTKNCEKYIYKKMNTINTLRLGIYCAANEKPKFVEQKIYRGFLEDSNNYGKVFEIKD